MLDFLMFQKNRVILISSNLDCLDRVFCVFRAGGHKVEYGLVTVAGYADLFSLTQKIQDQMR